MCILFLFLDFEDLKMYFDFKENLHNLNMYSNMQKSETN